jgi:hypothetical protein
MLFSLSKIPFRRAVNTYHLHIIYGQGSVLRVPLSSPTISTSSMVSECSESIGSESDNQINEVQLSSPTSPTKSTLSPVSELMNGKKGSAADD